MKPWRADGKLNLYPMAQEAGKRKEGETKVTGRLLKCFIVVKYVSLLSSSIFLAEVCSHKSAILRLQSIKQPVRQTSYLVTIDITSSSATAWPSPTRCGMCLALAPHTRAYLNFSFSERWIWSQTSSTVELLLTINASEKSGSSPLLFPLVGCQLLQIIQEACMTHLLV